MSAILADEPAPLSADLPPSLVSIARRCLQKDPQRRFSSGKDLLFALEQLAAAERFRPPTVRQIRIGVLGVVLAAGVVALAWYLVSRATSSMQRSSGPAAHTVGGMEEAAITRLTDTGALISFALTRDRKLLFYVHRTPNGSEVRLRHRPSESEIVLLPPAPGTQHGTLIISPDERFLYIWERIGRDVGAIRKIPLLGGFAELLLEKEGLLHFDLSRDGQWIAWPDRLEEGRLGVSLLRSDGSSRRMLANLDDELRLIGICWSPDGGTIVLLTSKDADGGRSELQQIGVADGRVTTLPLNETFHPQRLTWSPDGRRLVAVNQAGDILAIHPSTAGISVISSRSSYRSVVVLDDTSLAATLVDRGTSLWIHEPASGASERLGSGQEFEGDAGVAWTPSGEILFTSGSINSSEREIWTAASDGSNRRRLSSPPRGFRDVMPAISGDGRSLLFARAPAGAEGSTLIIRAAPDGSAPTPIYSTQDAVVELMVTPDSRSVLFVVTDRSSLKSRSLRLDLNGGVATALDVDCAVSAMTHDGRFVACTGDPSVVTVRPVGGGKPVWTRELAAPTVVRFTPAGELSYVSSSDQQRNVQLLAIGEFTPRALTGFDRDSIAKFAWSHDGTRLLVARLRSAIDGVLVENVNLTDR